MLLKRALIALALFISLLACDGAVAQTDAERARQLKEIEDKLKENERKADATRKAAEQRQEELRLLTDNMIDAANSLRSTEIRATELEASLADLEKKVAIAEVDLEAKQHSLSKLLAGLQKMELRRPPALAVSPEDASTAARAAITISAVAPKYVALAETLQAEIESISRLRAQKNKERQELAQVETDLGARKRILQELRDEKETEYREESALIARLERENTRLAARATSIRDLMAGITSQAPAVSPRPAPRPAAPKPAVTVNIPAAESSPGAASLHAQLLTGLPHKFSDAQGKLICPVVGQRVAKFGSTTPSGKKLEGIKIATASTFSVVAPFSGKIAFADNLKDIGNLIVLEVGDGYFLVLVGLSPEAKKIAAGTNVKAGEPLGYMPKSTMPGERQELYFEVRRTIGNNVTEPINPSKWLADIC